MMVEILCRRLIPNPVMKNFSFLLCLEPECLGRQFEENQRAIEKRLILIIDTQT